MQRIGDIELDQDLGFEARQWRLQQVARAVMALVIVAALLGAFGSGPFSSTRAGGEAAGVEVRYERFVRHTGEGDITIVMHPGQASEGQVELWIGQEWLGANQILLINPEPAGMHAGGDRQRYLFTIDDPAARFEVSIRFTPREMGRISAKMGVGDNPGISFTQFSYP